jgi:uncharacterized protein (TIGR02453 family)
LGVKSNIPEVTILSLPVREMHIFADRTFSLCLLILKTMKTIVLEFLEQLRDNNNREWFQQNKTTYEAARKEVKNFIASILPDMIAFDPSLRFVDPDDCMFRIFRDVRFSKDKSPYKLNMGAWITGAGRKSSGPGYYIHLQPDESFLAAGVYMPVPVDLKKIRNEIYFSIGEFKALLSDKNLRKYCDGLLSMDKLKSPPKDFPKDFPDIDLLKHKHYTVSCPVDDKKISDESFRDFVLGAYRAMYPLNLFLKRALEG